MAVKVGQIHSLPRGDKTFRQNSFILLLLFLYYYYYYYYDDDDDDDEDDNARNDYDGSEMKVFARHTAL